jgi:anti-sigma regulatory factor (Ser/Thr protein kinase)
MIGLLDSVNESYAAVPASLGAARRAVTTLARAAGATQEQFEDVRLATSEALTNVILHAYGERPGEIHVTAAVAGGELWVLVSDDGAGLHQGASKSGLGLGLTLIAQACDELTIVKRSSGGTELRMRFRLGAAPGHPGEAEGQLRGSDSSARSPASSIFSTTR